MSAAVPKVLQNWGHLELSASGLSKPMEWSIVGKVLDLLGKTLPSKSNLVMLA